MVSIQSIPVEFLQAQFRAQAGRAMDLDGLGGRFHGGLRSPAGLATDDA